MYVNSLWMRRTTRIHRKFHQLEKSYLSILDVMWSNITILLIAINLFVLANGKNIYCEMWVRTAFPLRNTLVTKILNAENQTNHSEEFKYQPKFIVIIREMLSKQMNIEHFHSGVVSRRIICQHHVSVLIERSGDRKWLFCSCPIHLSSSSYLPEGRSN